MSAESTSIVLTNGRVFDGTGKPVSDGGTVLIQDGIIVAAGPARDIITPTGSRIIDVRGRTVLPGLIDGHMHVTGMPGLLDDKARLQAQLRAGDILRECLFRGTTTVGHAGGCEENLVLRDMIDAGTLPGRARLLVSGVVTATGGHVRGDGADGPWEIRKMVRRMALAGMDFIKTCATGGFQWAHEGVGSPDYTLPELQALVEEARMRGRRVHVHAHAQPGIQNAVEAGCDVILHGAHIDARALDGMAARDLIYMPTLYITSEHTWGSGRLPEHMTSRMQAAYEPHREGVRQARELGLTLAAGTDGGPRPGAIMHELAQLVGCGLTPSEAIVAATRNTAVALGAGDRLGSLEPGKVADCIVVEGDPLADIDLLTAPESIVMVIKQGRVEVDHLPASMP